MSRKNIDRFAPVLPLLGGLVLLIGACETDDNSHAVDPAIFADLGEPIAALTLDERAQFERGRLVAERRFVPTTGLGPLFSATACLACHDKPTLGGSASRYRNVFVEEASGSQFEVSFQPQFSVQDGRAPDSEGATGVRSPQPLFGLGLLGEIPVEEILKSADPADADGDGISGRVNFERGFVGRFGRKSQMATLAGFVRLALLDHLGVTTPAVTAQSPLQVPGPRDLATRDSDDAADPELSEGDTADLIVFVSSLGAPRPAVPTVQSLEGEAVFAAIGCADCHLPSLSGPRGPIPAYTDLLLHDMGDDLADSVAVGAATGHEFRTQPLWGIGPVGPYLHDGRADSLDQAIRFHGGESASSRERYANAPSGDRAAVVAFLKSLGGDAYRENGLLPLDAEVPASGLGAPRSDLSEEESADFEMGRELFDRDFAYAEGLGPVFNGDACRSCHFDGGVGGAGPADVDVIRYGRSGSDGAFVAPTAGTMAHRHGRHSRPTLEPGFDFFERRQTPLLFGLGLIEEILSESISAAADPMDSDGDGVSGRVSVLSGGQIGRFGWKANVPTLRDFVRDALSNEMGLTVPTREGGFGFSADDDDVSDPEIGDVEIEALTSFMTHLAPPEPADELSMVAVALFEEVGCAACHTPALPTQDGTLARLYSDLLLHDVAPTGTVQVAEGSALNEIRTPPLWGLRFSAPYWHDGRARNVEHAVAAHEGEASASRIAFESLDAEGRELLLSLLSSL